MPEAIHVPAADGHALRGFAWRHAGPPARARPVVIVNSATSVACRYYERFGNALHEQGCDVLTYDYRGIGGSRHGPLRRLSAGWLDWGVHDFEGVLRYAAANFPGQPIYVVGHSIGGFVIGLAPSAYLVERIFTMGAQFAYWRDYARHARARMFVRWHVAMPLIARALGYVPAKRLGWMEDTPKGVALDWARMGPRFEASLRGADPTLASRFGQVRAPILALGVEDDPFGTVPAIDRLLGYYTRSERHHLRLAPAAISEAGIGHFAFFHQRFRASLWPLAMDWLLRQRLPAPLPGPLTHYPAQDGILAQEPGRPHPGTCLSPRDRNSP
ncbi:alpha/beta fold hydrolase [Verticiella sediminum]|uniref:Alpha/beta fold hydrolase n=1 Tax=Verticiella sediminum TaxID=1247510 RepID=A0A556ATZ2_9BURK|nr:alpha/beta fold hydrolase [Verticiella sediminum]TSH96412.1 alpha/beta fold hydrolase [Verticiella sediminum]